MNARVGYLVVQDLHRGEELWTLYKGVNKDLRDMFQGLCEKVKASPTERLEEIIKQECHRMIESEGK